MSVLTIMNKPEHNGQAYSVSHRTMTPFIKTIFFVFLLFTGLHALAGNATKGDRLYKAGKYQEALTYYLTPDAQEKPEVMNRIGYMYDYGQGVEKDASIGVRWYKKAAEQGYAKAQFNLGLCYQFGNGVKKDLNEAIKWFRKSAEQSHADAEAKMGYLTVTGTGIRQDFQQAMKWYRLAAEHGDTSAYYQIGLFYAQGNGVKKDKNRAAQYYIMGAEKGDPEAQYWLGRAYEQGRGIKHDPERALYWLKQSANKGNWQAMRELSVIYGSALLGQAIDEKLALQWGEKAEETRRKNGETNPDVERRLRFFGVDADRLTKDGQ